MKNIRLIIGSLILLIAGIINAQEKNDRVITKKGDVLEAVIYHDNGQIAQEGSYLDGKLHGEWISYDLQGNKTAMGKYAEGKKVGKWFFWKEGQLSEVDFSDNRIASVRTWSRNDLLVSE